MSLTNLLHQCGEMIEGKLNIDGSNNMMHRNMIRILLCSICTVLAAFMPGFVPIISFVGCFCVSIVGFVLPPLFFLRLSNSRQVDFLSGGILLLFGVITTFVTSVMTFRDLVTYTKNSGANNYSS